MYFSWGRRTAPCPALHCPALPTYPPPVPNLQINKCNSFILSFSLSRAFEYAPLGNRLLWDWEGSMAWVGLGWVGSSPKWRRKEGGGKRSRLQCGGWERGREEGTLGCAVHVCTYCAVRRVSHWVWERKEWKFSLSSLLELKGSLYTVVCTMQYVHLWVGRSGQFALNSKLRWCLTPVCLYSTERKGKTCLRKFLPPLALHIVHAHMTDCSNPHVMCLHFLLLFPEGANRCWTWTCPYSQGRSEDVDWKALTHILDFTNPHKSMR